MQAKFLRDDALRQLTQNLKTLFPRYMEDSPWLDDYFGHTRWSAESSVAIPDDLGLRLPDEDSDYDLENTRTIYTALKHLTPSQASDERLWAYMAHVTEWTYMRGRWPAERYANREKPYKPIRERYLFGSNRARSGTRHGIARLWWYGYTSYDESRADPFELTGVLLKTLDVTQSVLERAFSLNRPLTHGLLQALLEREQAGEPRYERETVRSVAKHIVHIGGVTIVDMLSTDDVKSIVHTKLDQLKSEAASSTTTL